MRAKASQITGVLIVYSTVCSCADQRRHQNSEPLAFVRGSHRWPVNSPHKVPITRKIIPFDDVIIVKQTRSRGNRFPCLTRITKLFLNDFWNPGVEVTKAPFANFSVSKNFDLEKVPVRFFKSHWYLTCVPAAELRRHLSNINVIFNS